MFVRYTNKQKTDYRKRVNAIVRELKRLEKDYEIPPVGVVRLILKKLEQ